MKKYNKLNKQQMLNLFQEKIVVNRADITSRYGCSVYSTRQIVNDLMDDKSIRLTNYGYRRVDSQL
jgi:hypothetical protein